MEARKVFDLEHLKETFRIKDGKLERYNRIGRSKTYRWKTVISNGTNSTGYCQVRFDGKFYGYHSILWTINSNKNIPCDLEIDHINGEKTDNRIENLRLVTTRQNSQNKEIHRNGKLVGTHFIKNKNLYTARIQIDGYRISLGYYKSEEKAHKAYEIACKHIKEYSSKNRFIELVKNEMGYYSYRAVGDMSNMTGLV